MAGKAQPDAHGKRPKQAQQPYETKREVDLIPTGCQPLYDLPRRLIDRQQAGHGKVVAGGQWGIDKSRPDQGHPYAGPRRSRRRLAAR